MHGLLLTHTACSNTSCILGLWAVNLVLINSGPVKERALVCMGNFKYISVV